MAEGRGTDFDAIDAEASFEHVVVPGVVFGAFSGPRRPKSTRGLAIDEGGPPGAIVRRFRLRFGGRLRIAFGIQVGVGFGHQDADHPKGGDEKREHPAGRTGIGRVMTGMGERSGDGPETIVRGNDLPDVVSTGAELNEGHGHGGGSLRSGWHRGVCHGVLNLFGSCQGDAPQFVR